LRHDRVERFHHLLRLAMPANFASAPEPAELRPGSRLGRYEILLGIAQGGMARVWAARQQGHRGFTKVVAIKTILPSLTSDPSFEEMFLDEARVAASVHHPNVCQIFDLGEESETLYLAMEWVNGDSLARILKPPAKGGDRPPAERLNARIAARIIADAAAGLHAAHELCDDTGQRLNVVHRDVSPQNILVSLTGNVKVTDFGVAKALGSSHQATAAGQVKGKAAYMSPEQASGERVDRRSDIFALGIVLYEITTGLRPFQGENQLATLKQLLDGRFDPPSALVPGYPRELEAIVLRALAMQAAQRFPNAERMRLALEEWLARSGPVVSETQIGAVVRERLGPLIDERQAKIRERMKAPQVDPRASQASFTQPSDGSGSNSAPSQISHVAQVASSPSAAAAPSAPHAPGPPPALPLAAPALPPPRRSSSAALLALSGVALLLSLLLALAVWRFVRAPDQAPAPIAAPAAAPEPPVQLSAIAPPPPAATVEVRSIKLRALEPKDGISFELDGSPLAADVSSIERPTPGTARLLAARAPGYEPDLYRIDDATPDELEVMLLKKQEGAGAIQQPQAPPPAQSPVKPGESKKPVLRPDIPDNPF
jgi:eukaryotic-like serine/threonine-protein kinase